ncbi:MAG: DNA-processing protein DprA [Alphaproteobacteria bacterium]|nr:DNA-processing protein DprA [Alphaproteobacteria bacterium]
MTRQHRQKLNRSEQADWLRLIRSENVGPITFFHLLQYYGSAGAALDALPALANRGGRRKIKICPTDVAERELARIEEIGATLIAHGEPAYPRALGAIEDAPPLIARLGDGKILERPVVAIVGARNASANGRRLASKLAGDLGKAGVTVVSGLARGIDTAAHTGALDSGTAAVVAGGIDVVYPKENQSLYEDIVARGVVLAESPPGIEPVARHFPRRNRLISGLSLGVVVVEAAPRSGSLITARMALEQGREVFAVPGSPLDPRARGTNNLIRQGATLTETAEDILQTISTQMTRPLAEPVGPTFDTLSDGPPSPDGLDAARKNIIELLSPTPAAVDELIRECQVSAALVAVVLLELELAGRIERHPGGRVSLIIE